MPSFLLGFLSGGQDILAGNFWSGQGAFHPVGGVQLTADGNNSGSIYVALSGGLTIQSGGLTAASGGMANLSGAMDGMQMRPGAGYFIPKIGIGLSGSPSIYVNPDAACSGQARLYMEPF